MGFEILGKTYCLVSKTVHLLLERLNVGSVNMGFKFKTHIYTYIYTFYLHLHFWILKLTLLMSLVNVSDICSHDMEIPPWFSSGFGGYVGSVRFSYTTPGRRGQLFDPPSKPQCRVAIYCLTLI